MTDGVDRRHRVQIHYHEAPHDGPVEGMAIPLVLELDPPVAGNINAVEARIGRSMAQARISARRFFDNDSQTSLNFMANGDVRAIAQLWHALHIAHGNEIPVSFLRLGDERETDELVVEGFVTSADLESTLKEVEQKCDLGVRTASLDPPIYLNAFWGEPHGRAYGQLDAEIAQLNQFDIVPKELLDKARRVDAPNNWAVVYPQDLPDRDRVLEALEPLIKYRNGGTFELSSGHDPSSLFRFLEELSRLPIEERPYYLLGLGDFDVLSINFQYFLQSFGAAGRLAFAHPDAYREYAEKIIRYEDVLDESEPPGPTYIATDYDDVNARNYAELVQPLAEAPDLPTPREVLARGRAYKERVMEVLKTIPSRSSLLIFAHGFEHSTTRGCPVEAVFEDMRQFQGSIILDDFEAPRPLGSAAGLLCASDVADGPVSPGGIVILHACYSAGVIKRDTMPEWIHLQMPERVPPQKPFVSRLAQTLLSNPQGPLAVYGHINRSHQSNYYDPSSEDESYPYRHYYEMVTTLAKGLPVGIGRGSCRRMTIAYMDQAMTLSHQIEALLTGQSRGGEFIGRPRKGIDSFERSFLQYSFGACNFRNYMIVGDPMARIRNATPGG